MCGYFGNLHECPAVVDLMNGLGMRLPYPQGRAYCMRDVEGLITAAEDGYQIGQAVWWYELEEKEGKLVPVKSRSTFNARNLHYPTWREPINKRRGVVFATEIGETQGKAHYLMRAPAGLAIGAVYADYETNEGPVRSMALITRPATPGFAKFHEKAQPLFLPLELETIKTWLDPSIPANDDRIKSILDHPRVTTDLEITPVNKFKEGKPVGETEKLAAEAAEE